METIAYFISALTVLLLAFLLLGLAGEFVLRFFVHPSIQLDDSDFVERRQP